MLIPGRERAVQILGASGEQICSVEMIILGALPGLPSLGIDVACFSSFKSRSVMFFACFADSRCFLTRCLNNASHLSPAITVFSLG
jgi:hypothetical protein